MPRIVIDARQSGTSTGRYVDKLIENLHKLKSEDEFVILGKQHRLDYLRTIAPGFSVELCPYKEFTFAEQLSFWRQLKRLKPALVHFPMVQQPVLYRGKTVTTMNDLTTVRFRNPAKNPLVFRLKQLVYIWVNRRVAHKATKLLTYTQFVKDDVVQFTHVSPDKISVTPLAADRIEEPAVPIEELVGKQFIMYVGKPMPHKNLDRLIDAFEQLQANHPELHLALAGKKDANYERTERRVKQRSIKQIVFTDFIGDGQLRWLYENCAAYVFPSLSEGFGLPGLEALAHGAPLVSSNATCLPEVYGDAALYFDPKNSTAMAGAIDQVLGDQKLRAELIAKGKQRVGTFSWDKLARETLAVYKAALDS